MVTGVGAPAATGLQSLESLVHAAASAALQDAEMSRDDLDGIVIAASDLVDGRAISSMLTAAPAGAYLNEEINVASSPGHALAMAYLQILSGTHRRLLVTSWGKASETARGDTEGAERLTLDPFFERDGGMSALAAAAMQAVHHRTAAGAGADEAAARVAARNHGPDGPDAGAVAASPLRAYPLRELECPPPIDSAFSILLERRDRAAGGVELQGLGWCSETARLSERELTGLPHLERAAADAFARAGVGDPATEVDAWELHDYTPDAELLAYGAVGLCPRGHGVALARAGETSPGGRYAVNRGGGSVRGEAPFGGPLRKVVDAVRQVRGDAGEAQVPGVRRAFAQIASGLAGQFQTAVVVGRAG